VKFCLSRWMGLEPGGGELSKREDVQTEIGRNWRRRLACIIRSRGTNWRLPKRVRQFVAGESGSILVITAVSMFVLVAVLGFAIDAGHFRNVQRQLQRAADAAALAGALEIRVCGNTSNCPVMQSAAQDALVENGLSAGTFLTQCTGTPAPSGVTLMVDNPTCTNGSDPNAQNDNYVEAVVTEQVPTYFMSLLGIPSAQVSARAEAMRGGGPCIYALNKTGAAIVVVAGVIVKSNCDIVDESASSDALTCVVGFFMQAPSVNITGNPASLLCLGDTVPHTGVPVPTPADPLAYLPAPDSANASCGSSTGSPYFGSSQPVSILLGGNYVFNPGVYCGGISITAALLSNITFNPGTYVLRDTGGLLGLSVGGLNITASALSTITGNGVTFYNEGPNTGFAVTEPVTNSSILSLNNFNLSAPSSGEYTGVLFFQAHDVTAPDTFLVSTLDGGNFQGAVYAPDASVNYGVSALSSAYNILVAGNINFLAPVASVFGNNYASLQGGSPLNGNIATLAQ
jgi:Flp pilus assembly protein TadG